MSGQQIGQRTFEGTCTMEGAICENCGRGTMRRFAQDSFYYYLKCQNKACQKERLELKADSGSPESMVNRVNSVHQE